HTEKPQAKRSQRGSRLSRGFLQSAAGLHQKCGRAHFVPALTYKTFRFGCACVSRRATGGTTHPTRVEESRGEAPRSRTRHFEPLRRDERQLLPPVVLRNRR